MRAELNQRPVVSDKAPGPYGFAEMKIPTNRQKVVKQLRLIRRKKTPVCMDTRGWAQRSTRTLLVVRILVARILAFCHRSQLKKKERKKNKDRVWRKQTGDFNSRP